MSGAGGLEAGAGDAQIRLDALQRHLERVDAQIARLEQELNEQGMDTPALEDLDIPPPPEETLTPDQDAFTRLLSLFHLGRLEADLLRIALAPELSPSIAVAMGRLQGDARPARARVGLAMRMLEPDPVQRQALLLLLQEHAPLLSHQLILLLAPYGSPSPIVIEQELALPPGVLWQLLGSGRPDPEQTAYARLREPVGSLDALDLPPGTERVLKNLMGGMRGQRLLSSSDSRTLPPSCLINFWGPSGTGRRSAGDVLADAWGMKVLEIDLRQVPEEVLLGSVFPAQVLRDARILNAVPVFRHIDRLPLKQRGPDGQPQSILPYERFIRRLADYPGPIILISPDPLEVRRAWIERECVHASFVVAADAGHRLRLWQRVIDAREEALAEDVRLEALGAYPFSPGQMHDALWASRNAAVARGNGQGPLTLGDLREGCGLQMRHDLESLSRRTPTTFRLSDLVIQEPVRKQLQLFQGFIQNRERVYVDWGLGARLAYGRGLKALFHGPSGTGKTMAAQAISSTLQLDLFKIDMAALVSKWVGETEKNINRIFDEARLSNAILLFDEADAIFGKRGAVDKGSDRYSNMEINHLLQRFEEYDGVVILTSNYPRGIDDAFSRRMHFVIEFPMPDQKLRLQIWQSILPPSMPMGSDVKLDVLATKFELAGGNIINVVQTAAFLAAERDRDVQMIDFIRAVQWEYQKMGRGVAKQEFGEYFDQIE